MRESISISLPPDLKADLDAAIEAEGGTRCDIVREALREYPFARRLRALRLELMPYAQAHGIHTDDDVFEAVS